jgi:Spy/CpxP family protein refolding chaperone
MKKILALLAVMLIVITPIIMADDDAPTAQTTKGVRVVEMQMDDDDAGPMMGMNCGDMGRGMMMGRGMGMMKGCCDDDNMGPGMGMCCNLLHCKDLNLTKEQIQKIKDINFVHRSAMIDMKAALEKAQLRMREQMSADSPDKAKALAAAREINTVKGQMAEARINHIFSLKGVLTAEQLEKVKACRAGGMCGQGPMGMGQGAKASCGKPCRGPAGCGKGK